MTNDQITQLYRFMVERFDALDAKFDQKADKVDLDHAYNILDQHAGRLEVLEDEYAAIGQSLDRIDTRLDGIDTRLDRIDTRLDGINKNVSGIAHKVGYELV